MEKRYASHSCCMESVVVIIFAVLHIHTLGSRAFRNLLHLGSVFTLRSSTTGSRLCQPHVYGMSLKREPVRRILLLASLFEFPKC